MKYALYIIESGVVAQWQDTEAFNYAPPPPWTVLLELFDPLPPEFSVFNAP